MADIQKNEDVKLSFYIVEDFASYKNLSRYDTIEKAIEAFKALPQDRFCGLGASFYRPLNGGGQFILGELDLVHRHYDKPCVLLNDVNEVGGPLWKRADVHSAIDTAIAHLNIQYQKSSLDRNLPCGRVVVPLDRYQSKELDPYFKDKLLAPSVRLRSYSAIAEAFVEGSGWLKNSAFLDKLAEHASLNYLDPDRNVYVTSLSVNCVDEKGVSHQVDITPHDYELLRAKTERELSPEKLASDLYQFAVEHDYYEAQDQNHLWEQELKAIEQDISVGHLYPYTQYLTTSLEEGFASEEDRNKAVSLLNRLSLITPREFREPILNTIVSQMTEPQKQQLNDLITRASEKQQKQTPMHNPERNEERGQ